MTPNPSVMQAVEKLGYRVTVGDVATQAGLNLAEANQGLLALATDAGGHLQVAETGDVVYLFPRNFRDILRNKYFQIKLQEWWQKVWGVLFYLIRISFGIFLILSIVLITVAIIVIINALNSSNDNDNRSSNSGGSWGFFYIPDLFWYFNPNYQSYPEQRRRSRERDEMNFFEAVFSFLFGDGNPNARLEERRWQSIAGVIRTHQGAVAAEQLSPYLDDLGATYQQEYEDYMLPVLLRFNGQPKVSPEGQIVYYFPELQVKASKKQQESISPYLEELPWRFSAASSGQIMLSAGLGVVNLVGALILGSLLRGGAIAAQLGGFVAFVQGIYWLLLAYGIGFLSVPLIRYFWIQGRNRKVANRNRDRISRARLLAKPDPALQHKIDYARQFGTETVINQENLVYSTENDLLEQEIERQQLDSGD